MPFFRKRNRLSFRPEFALCCCCCALFLCLLACAIYRKDEDADAIEPTYDANRHPTSLFRLLDDELYRVPLLPATNASYTLIIVSVDRNQALYLDYLTSSLSQQLIGWHAHVSAVIFNADADLALRAHLRRWDSRC